MRSVGMERGGTSDFFLPTGSLVSAPSQIQKREHVGLGSCSLFNSLERGAQAVLYSASSDLLKVKFDILPDMEGYLW